MAIDPTTGGYYNPDLAKGGATFIHTDHQMTGKEISSNLPQLDYRSEALYNALRFADSQRHKDLTIEQFMELVNKIYTFYNGNTEKLD